jgi:ferredoxin
MSVNVKFSDREAEGVIAEGTYVWDAAKRLGVRLPAECAGKGQCDTCAVVIEEGMSVLSSLTDAEREHLSPERLAAGERLACQTRIERGGDLRLRLAPVTEREATSEESLRDIGREFREMPLDQKLRTLVEFEVVTAYQTLKTIADVPSLIGGKVLDLMAGRGRSLDRRDRRERRPAEHKSSEIVVVSDHHTPTQT